MTSAEQQFEIRDSQFCRRVLCTFAATWIVLACAPSSEARPADSISIFHCTFGDDWDVNYDRWPDRWVRKSGLDYPHYVNIAIQSDDAVADKKCLQIDVDGAAAAVETPPIPVLSRFSYEFEAQLKNEGLQYSAVVVSLNFCNAAGRVLQTAKTDPISSTSGWQRVRIGPIEPSDAAIDHAVLGLTVIRGSKGDLHGRVSFADLRLERLPRIDVSTNNSCNVYTDRDGVTVQCALSGIRERDPEIDFQLLDISNKVLQSEHFRLNGRLIVNKRAHGSGATDGAGAPDGYEGTINWQPKVPDYGFYRVVVRMTSLETATGKPGAEHQLGGRTVDFVVVPPLEMPQRGEFGWTLPEGDQPLSFQDLSRLLPQVGINWAKVPVWFDANDQQRGDELIRFVELLGASNIDVVGIIDRPPSKLAASGHMTRNLSIAEILSQDPASWSAALDPVMSRLALRVRWWQFGRDNDTSLISQPKLKIRMEDLRTTLFRFGQDVRMGLCADWDSADTHTGKVSWDFTQLVLQSQPTDKKFEALLSKSRPNSAERWVAVDPPLASDYQPTPTADEIAQCAPVGPTCFGGDFLISAWIRAGFDASQQSEAARTAHKCVRTSAGHS